MTWKGKILSFSFGFWHRRALQQQGKGLDLSWHGQVGEIMVSDFSVAGLGGLGAMLAGASGAEGIWAGVRLMIVTGSRDVLCLWKGGRSGGGGVYVVWRSCCDP